MQLKMFRSNEMEIFCAKAVNDDWMNCIVHQTYIIIMDELLAARFIL